MAISSTSRYRSATLQTVDSPSGTILEMRVPWPQARRIQYTYYRVLQGDRIDTIAHDFYGNGQLWWMIADANPEVIEWLDLEPGEVLRIPNA